MLTQHIALVPEVAGINASELARVSAALQKQMIRDFSPVWQVAATVDPFPHLEDVPVGYWPIILAFGELGTDEGVHCDRKGQPYALIEMSPSWSLTASHVCMEMLIDPYGNRTVVGPSPRSDQGSVEFLLDVCDPCEDARYAYTVNDVLVSDFCTPEFLAQVPSGKERYSFTGAVEAPYQVLPSGRLSWYDPATNRWWQRNHFGGAARDTDLGFIERRAGRGFSVNHPRAPKHLQATKLSLEAYEARMGIQRQRALHASQSQAHLLRVHLGNPGGVGDLAIDASGPTGGSLGNHRSGLSDRPQVLAALIKKTVGGANGTNGADAASMHRRSLAEALATTEERGVVGASTLRGVGDQRTQLSASQPDPSGFEALEDTVHAYEAKPPPAAVQAPSVVVQRPADEHREPGDESFARQQARLQVEKRVQTQRTAQAWAAQRPRDARRTTIPPPMPRTAAPPPSMMGASGRTTSRVAPSLAPTSMGVTGSSIPVTRPLSSLRDRLILGATVGAAALAAVALYGSSGAPTSAPAAAGSGHPLPTVATVLPPPTAPTASAPTAATTAGLATPTVSSGEHRSVEILPGPKPAAEAPSPGSAPPPPPHAAAAPRAAKGPRPRLAKQPASNNPYDDMQPGPMPTAAAATGEPLDRLVDDRR